MKKIGLYGGAFKPFTRGHYSVVLQASRENEHVYLFVSQKDRKRKGEAPVLWAQMKRVWALYLKKIMPENVEVVYVDSPVGSQLETLIQAGEDERETDSIFSIYADNSDIDANFNNPRIRGKYLAPLLEQDRINFVSVDRNLTPTSGTKVRQFLRSGMAEEFIRELPLPLKNHGPEIFDILSTFENR